MNLERCVLTSKQVFHANMRASGMGGFKRFIHNCFIGAAYPPCTRPLADLKPIYLRDLTLETQHRGCVLVVRAFSVPNKMTSIQNAVEDENGDVARLAIYNLLPSVLANELLPKGTLIAIKEP
jgi:hypothetical protein